MDNYPLKPFPSTLLKHYKKWKSTEFEENKALHARLSEQGQEPEAMIISCCDSRVNPTSIFGTDIGQFFIHRNIANLVPPYRTDTAHSGTPAALEYAIENLKVPHLIILGHSKCGGIKGGYELHIKHSFGTGERNNFVQQWLKILLPAIKKLDKNLPFEKAISQLEKVSIISSIDNILTYPFVEKAVKNGKLSIYGLWHNISSGDLERYNSETKAFELLE